MIGMLRCHYLLISNENSAKHVHVAVYLQNSALTTWPKLLKRDYLAESRVPLPLAHHSTQNSSLQNSTHSRPMELINSSTLVALQAQSDNAVPSPLQRQSVSRPAKKGTRPRRSSNFGSEEDLILHRETTACKNHIAPTGETRERFGLAVCKAKATNNLLKRLT